MKKKSIQHELPQAWEVFNLHGECAEDPLRVIREREAAAKAEAEAKAFALRCQKTFEQCPGFVGCDAPRGPGLAGRVVVDPAFAAEARDFLKKRFHVNESLELDAGGSLAIEVAARQRSKPGQRRARVMFDKPVQFEFDLAS